VKTENRVKTLKQGENRVKQGENRVKTLKQGENRVKQGENRVKTIGIRPRNLSAAAPRISGWCCGDRISQKIPGTPVSVSVKD